MSTIIPRYIIVHHEAGNNGFDSVNNYHKKLWDFKSSLGYYIGYQYYINKKGIVTQGRADSDVGAHCIADKMNFKSIGICLMGDFNNEMPSPEQAKALAGLLRELCPKYAIGGNAILAHRDVAGASTECYGNNLASDWAKDLFLLAPTEPTPPENVVVVCLKKILEELKKLVAYFKNNKSV